MNQKILPNSWFQQQTWGPKQEKVWICQDNRCGFHQCRLGINLRIGIIGLQNLTLREHPANNWIKPTKMWFSWTTMRLRQANMWMCHTKMRIGPAKTRKKSLVTVEQTQHFLRSVRDPCSPLHCYFWLYINVYIYIYIYICIYIYTYNVYI